MSSAVTSKDVSASDSVAHFGVDPATILAALAAGRVLLGAAVMIWPAAAGRFSGLDAATARRAAWLARMLGARDAALGVGALGTSRTSWAVAGAACDAVDAVAITAAARQGRLPRARGALFTGVAVASSLGGLAAGLSRRRRG